MRRNNIIVFVFVIVALIQLYVPAKMIIAKEDVLQNGKAFKFRTEPIDPNDPFRGKYIVLSFKEREFVTKDKYPWLNGDKIFLTFDSDSAGFAKIRSVSKEAPASSTEYLEAKVDYVSRGQTTNTLSLEYSFDRFYMEESKAPQAEAVYRAAQIDSAQVAYALVKLKNGEAALQDVIVNGTPIKELVNKSRIDN